MKFLGDVGVRISGRVYAHLMTRIAPTRARVPRAHVPGRASGRAAGEENMHLLYGWGRSRSLNRRKRTRAATRASRVFPALPLPLAHPVAWHCIFAAFRKLRGKAARGPIIAINAVTRRCAPRNRLRQRHSWNAYRPRVSVFSFFLSCHKKDGKIRRSRASLSPPPPTYRVFL